MHSSTTALSDNSKQKLLALLADKQLQQALNYALLLKNFHPTDPQLYEFISIIWLAGNQHQKALENIDKALELDPNFIGAHANKGVILKNIGQLNEAMASCKKALDLDPRHLGTLLNAGDICVEQEKYDEAINFYDTALRIKPDFISAHSNRGLALRRLNRLEEALSSYSNALEIDPNHVHSLANKGNALYESNRLEEALHYSNKALKLDPDHKNARLNLGSILISMGKYEAGLQEIDKVIAHFPNNAIAHSNKAHALLATGNFEQGWPSYEWRLQKTDYILPLPENIARWNGEDLTGKKLLLLADQGLGDQIQFVRYVQHVAEQGAKIHLKCDPKLINLFKNSLPIDELNLDDDKSQGADYYCPLSSLAGHFKEDLTHPHKTPYLFANEQLVKSWSNHLASFKGFRVGASWQGSPTFKNDKQRSFPLNHFSAIAKLDHVKLISLQKGEVGVSQIPTFRQEHEIVDIDELLSRDSDMNDAAAVIMNLNLVITSCTSIAHLAGALGVPTWVVLGNVADWRWQLDREDTPWYPNTRLFRQTETGSWDDVFERMAANLKTKVTQETGSDILEQKSYHPV